MKTVYKKLLWLALVSFSHTLCMQEDEATRKENDRIIRKLFAQNKKYALTLVGQAEKMRSSIKMKEKDKNGRSDTLSSFDGKTGYVRIPLENGQECYRTISRFKELIDEPLSEGEADEDILEGPNRAVTIPNDNSDEKVKKPCCCILY